MSYNVFNTKAEADAGKAYINAHPLFDNGGIVGNVKGQPVPNNQRTTNYYDDSQPKELLDGRWALSKIPQDRLDYYGIGQDQVDAYALAHPHVVEELSKADFVQPPEEE